MEQRSRVRADLKSMGVVKVTKTAIVKAVERIINGKQFEPKISKRELVEFVNNNIKGHWCDSNGVLKVNFEIGYVDTNKYPPLVTEPRNLTSRSNLIQMGSFRFIVEGDSLEKALVEVITGVRIHFNDLRKKIDIFI